MKFFIDILKGMVIGLANIIPGVSGGTMMVSMGIYDTLIYCITHLFKQFKKSLMTLLPFVVGMIAALAILSNVITWALMDEFASLPTNTLFIGLILGGLPAIFKQIKGSKKRDSILGGILFVLFFALVIFMATLKETQDTGAVISLSVLEVLKLTLMGCIASATMVIPGVSGSMMLMLMGYYYPVIGAIKNLINALVALDGGAILYNVGILLPFGIGVVIGIFAIAKLISPQPGNVKIHVSIMSFTIPKLMAEILFTAPTPIIALVFVWVVDTGIPNRLEKRRHIAPARSAEKP